MLLGRFILGRAGHGVRRHLSCLFCLPLPPGISPVLFYLPTWFPSCFPTHSDTGPHSLKAIKWFPHLVVTITLYFLAHEFLKEGEVSSQLEYWIGYKSL
jgi:hypothetical protein